MARDLNTFEDMFELRMGSLRGRPSDGASFSKRLDKRLGRIRRFGAAKPAGGARAQFVSHASDPRRRAIVKVHYFSHGGGGGAALRAHGRYVARDGAERGDLSPGQEVREAEVDRADAHARYLSRDTEIGFYDRTENGIDGGARMAEWSRADARHFRVILAAENGGQIHDLHAYTREVMSRAEAMLDRGPLDWVAVDHWDTDNPHTHIVLRGRLANGRPLGLPRDFVSHQFREIARDVASERIGPRGPDEERLALDREIRRHGPTRLDRFIAERLDLNQEARLADLSRGVDNPDLARRVRSRADELIRLGLAERKDHGLVRFDRDWQARLEGLEMHLDVRRWLVRERQYERDLHRAGERLSRETGKPFQKAPDREQTWRVRDSLDVGGNKHLVLERRDAVTLAPAPRGMDLNPGQNLRLGPDRNVVKLVRGLGLDR